MSLIVGIEYKGAVYMGADCGGWRNGFEDAGASSKLIRIGPLLVGCTGDLRAQNVLEHGVVDLPEITGPVERYLVREFIPRLRKAMAEHGACKKYDDSDGAEGWGGWLLVGVHGELHQISGVYCVFRNTRGYAAVGAEAGQGIALGVLFATLSHDPQERIRKALAAAEEHTDVCRSPFVIETLPAPKSALGRVA